MGVSTPSELVGRQAESVGLVCVTFTAEQFELAKGVGSAASFSDTW